MLCSIIAYHYINEYIHLNTYMISFIYIYIYIYTSRFTYKNYISIHMYFFSAAVMFLGRGCRIEGVEEKPLDYILVGFRSELTLVEHRVEGFWDDWHGAVLVARQLESRPCIIVSAWEILLGHAIAQREPAVGGLADAAHAGLEATPAACMVVWHAAALGHLSGTKFPVVHEH